MCVIGSQVGRGNEERKSCRYSGDSRTISVNDVCVCVCVCFTGGRGPCDLHTYRLMRIPFLHVHAADRVDNSRLNWVTCKEFLYDNLS